LDKGIGPSEHKSGPISGRDFSRPAQSPQDSGQQGNSAEIDPQSRGLEPRKPKVKIKDIRTSLQWAGRQQGLFAAELNRQTEDVQRITNTFSEQRKNEARQLMEQMRDIIQIKLKRVKDSITGSIRYMEERGMKDSDDAPDNIRELSKLIYQSQKEIREILEENRRKMENSSREQGSSSIE
jgi:hypothetical protein